MVLNITAAIKASYTALSHADRRRLLLRLGVSESTLYRRLRAPAQWTVYELAVLRQYLGLTMHDIEDMLNDASH